jgi:hypothetical protein
MIDHNDQTTAPQFPTDNAAQEKIMTQARPVEERTHYSPLAIIGICFAFFMLGNIIGSLVMLALAAANGLDFMTVLKSLNEDSPIGTRNFMRATLFINHLFSFILPAIATAVFCYRHHVWTYFRMKEKPSMRQIGLACLWFIVSIPLVQFAYQINKSLPLPQWMLSMEQNQSGILQAIIAKENFYEIIINVLLIGFIPAIGEEMMFRGLLQQQIGRLLKNEHIIVWLSAAIFSAVHLQFQGFLARMVLGALLGYMLIWTRNMWIPMLLHLLNNGLQVIGIYAFNIKSSEMDKLSEADKMPWYLVAASFVLAMGLGQYFRDHHNSPPKPSYTEGVF